MKILILASNKDRHYFFCNQIIENFNNVVGVIVEPKRKKKIDLLSYLKKKFARLFFRKYGKAFNDEIELAEKLFFQGSKKYFFEKYNHLFIKEIDTKNSDINDPHSVSLIQGLEPDVILVMGTSIIKKEIIESTRNILNMHIGLSPYYRGSNTNAWPIIDKKPNMFGVTIHELSKGIDKGNIIFTVQPELSNDDNCGIINAKCMKLGVKKVLECLKNIENNSYHSIEQWAPGKLYHDRDWNDYSSYLYFKRKKRIIHQSIKNIKNKSVPKIYLVNNGKKNVQTI